jgi:hypothetical protein
VSRGFLFVLRGMSPGEHVVHASIFVDGEHVFDVSWNLEVVA